MDFDCIFQKICLIVFYRYSFERSCWWQACRYAKVCKRDCYKGIFKKFMAKKTGYSWPLSTK